MSIVKQVLNDLYISCHWVVGRKNITSMSKKLQTSVWNEVGDLPQGYTSAYSEMPGELDKVTKEKERLEKAMKAPIDIEKIRERGY